MESNDKTAEEIELESKIWDALREKAYSSSIDDHILPVKKVVYDYSAQQLKEYKEVIRELLPLAESGQAYYRQNPGFNWVKEREKSAVIIHKARKLIDQTDSTK